MLYTSFDQDSWRVPQYNMVSPSSTPRGRQDSPSPPATCPSHALEKDDERERENYSQKGNPSRHAYVKGVSPHLLQVDMKIEISPECLVPGNPGLRPGHNWGIRVQQQPLSIPLWTLHHDIAAWPAEHANSMNRESSGHRLHAPPCIYEKTLLARHNFCHTYRSERERERATQGGA